MTKSPSVCPKNVVAPHSGGCAEAKPKAALRIERVAIARTIRAMVPPLLTAVTTRIRFQFSSNAGNSVRDVDGKPGLIVRKQGRRSTRMDVHVPQVRVHVLSSGIDDLCAVG